MSAGEFQGTQVEGLAAGTPFIYCVGHRNRVAGQRVWSGELIREHPGGVDKRGNQVPEIIRAGWATCVAANTIHAVEAGWWDSEKVFDADVTQPTISPVVGQTVTVDWESAFTTSPGSNIDEIFVRRWHLVIETVSDASGVAVSGAPDLSGYQAGHLVTISYNGQSSRQHGQSAIDPWEVVSSEALPKGNSRLVLDLLRNPRDAHGWWDGLAPMLLSNGIPTRVSGPFNWPPAQAAFTITNSLVSRWKLGVLRDPATGFEVRTGGSDQAQLNTMLAAVGNDAEHFPGLSVVGVGQANVANFGNRQPNSEWLVRCHEDEINIDSAIEIVMRDRLGFRDQDANDPEFDATALRADNPAGIEPPPVHGYQWPAGLTGYEIMQPLMMVGGVRVHERGGRAIFDYLARRDIADLVVGDLDARPFGDRPSDRGVIETEPAAELDAPDEINVHFADVDNDNQKQVAAAVRQGIRIGNQDVIREDVRLENMAMTYERASGLSQDLLREAWERRDGARIRLPLTWDYLEPGDVIRMAGNDAPGGGPWLLAIDRIERGDMLEIECYQLSSPPIDAPAEGSTFDRDQPRIQSAAPLAFDVIDLGPLRDEHATTPGYYVATCRTAPSPGPIGGSLYRRQPGEPNPHRIGPVEHRTAIGWTVHDAANVLAGAATDVIDEGSSIDVEILDEAGPTLASVTESELLDGANQCVIGNEVLAFRDAVALETGPRRYRLSGFLRGRNGTDIAVSAHAAGERFVFLGHRDDVLPLQFVPTDLDDVGKVHEIQAVHVGGSTDTANMFPHTVQASTGRPLPPANFRAVSMPNGDVRFEWDRRSRLAWDSLDEPPALEAAESYVVEINDGARTTTIENAKVWTYTAAMQAADVLGLTFTATVRQRDPAAVAGPAASLTVTI